MADLSKLRFNGTDYNVKDTSAPLRKFTNYSKTGNLPITSDDTTQTAIGKLEKALDDKINTSAKGIASGVAELDANGKVPSSQLPSYVDDVLEYSAKSSFPATGETGKIYVDTTTNKTYRWSGSAYVEISESLALGETSSTAYRGDRGKAAYDHSQITNGNPHGTTGANTNLTGYYKGSSEDAVAATDTVNAAIAKHENRINANQSNILYVSEHNANRNLLLNTASTTTIDGVTFTVNADKSVTITGSQNNPNQHTKFVLGKFTANRSDLVLDSGIAASASANIFINTQDGVTTTRNLGHATITGTDLNTERDYQILVIAGTSNINTTIKPMICTQADWNATQEYEASGGLANYDLTRLESEDRAELVELVDSGAKNQLDMSSILDSQIYKGDEITLTRDAANEFTITRASSSAVAEVKIPLPTSLPINTPLILSGCPSGGTYATYSVEIWENNLGSNVYDMGSGSDPYTFTTTTGRYLRIRYGANTSYSNQKFKFMFCTKAAFGVSNKFVPYRPNYDLVVSEIGHHTVDDGNTNHSTATCNCSNWTAGVYLVAVNRYQNPTTAYGTALYLMTVNDNILPLFTTIVETADCKATFALSNDKVLSITYPHSAFWQAYAKRI